MIENLLERLYRMADAAAIEGLDIAASPALMREYRAQIGVVSDGIRDLQEISTAEEWDYAQIAALSTARGATEELLGMLSQAEPIQRQCFAKLIDEVLRAILVLQQPGSAQPASWVIEAAHLFQSDRHRMRAGSSAASSTLAAMRTAEALEPIQERMGSSVVRERAVGTPAEHEAIPRQLTLAAILEAIERIELPSDTHWDSYLREYIGRALYKELLSIAPERRASVVRRR